MSKDLPKKDIAQLCSEILEQLPDVDFKKSFDII